MAVLGSPGRFRKEKSSHFGQGHGSGKVDKQCSVLN